MYHLGIIGGGPAGYTAAEKVAKAGRKVIIFEKEKLGGVCLNQGCIPTKTLLYSAKIVETIGNSTKYGITCDSFSFDYGKIVARKNKVVRKLNAGIRAKMKHPNITLITAEVQISSQDTSGFVLNAEGKEYLVEKILICSGSENVIPPIQGIETIEYWTNTEALNAKILPQSIIIIGGGVIGIEFANLYATLGVEVTVIEMASEILGQNDKEISQLLREELTKKGVVFHLSSTVVSVATNQVVFEKEEESIQVTAEKILVSIGRKPILKNIGLENISIKTDRNGIITNDQMQTSVQGVYAAGDVTGKSLLAHTAVREAEVAIENILGTTTTMKYNAIPGVIYTNPEMASVGETEELAGKRGVATTVYRLPMSYSGRFVAENEGKNGLCKIVVAKENQKILGVQLLGNPASEIITTATLAIENEMTATQWTASIFPHPTVSEIMKECLIEGTE